ncbi:phosphatidylinositol-specific phospholipase C/glycerophosphodiester phosphodiesterase family protein [Streptomyces hundungensis]|uniref:phosphatidylinositol-specific phospholipase C/glycerophosphodiester phosphodiesterase family protein n=1 Tax=Streptomyces hundungensis TaxID=1077946 RepID=UPI0033C89678
MDHPTRRTAVATLAAALAVPALAGTARAAGRPAGPRPLPRPLPRSHAHNDYEHTHPLYDALAHGFTSVEADIFLVEGRLLVGHDPTELDPSRTLESLYLDPLRRLIRANGGSVYGGWRRPFQLLIDIKTEGAATYRELDRRLRPYRALLSSCAHGRVRAGAVTPVVSGDRGARVPMEAQPLRYAFYDGRLDDLGSGATASFIPLISESWTDHFTWTGAGPFPADERARLRDLVARVHADHRRLRFWATPDLAGPQRDALWRELYAAGLDWFNTDDLAGLEAFLRHANGG